MRSASIVLLWLSFITGVLYPLFVTIFAAIGYASSAQGSTIHRDGIVVGSELIGQEFHSPHYFWGRLSATSPRPYTAFDPEHLSGSSGSNYGPLHPALLAAAEARIAALRAAERAVLADSSQRVPIDLVTASGSGLDPHISPSAARYQAERVALARRAPRERIDALVHEHTRARQWGFLGEPVVNVLLLNLALDRELPLTDAR